jgi:hypothetical protein
LHYLELLIRKLLNKTNPLLCEKRDEKEENLIARLILVHNRQRWLIELEGAICLKLILARIINSRLRLEIKILDLMQMILLILICGEH